MKWKRPERNEYSAFNATYVNKVEGVIIPDMLRNQAASLKNYLAGLNADQWAYAYGEGKWTVKELILHINDAERVFAYRALRIGRGDQTPLPGFDQDPYVPTYHTETRSGVNILREFEAVRNATIQLFDSFLPFDYERTGIASDHEISVRALGFVILGHVQHHYDILQERYFPQ